MWRCRLNSCVTYAPSLVTLCLHCFALLSPTWHWLAINYMTHHIALVEKNKTHSCFVWSCLQSIALCIKSHESQPQPLHLLRATNMFNVCHLVEDEIHACIMWSWANATGISKSWVQFSRTSTLMKYVPWYCECTLNGFGNGSLDWMLKCNRESCMC